MAVVSVLHHSGYYQLHINAEPGSVKRFLLRFDSLISKDPFNIGSKRRAILHSATFVLDHIKMSLIVAGSIAIIAAFFLWHYCCQLFFSPLARIPGPLLYALTGWRLAYEDYKGDRSRTIYKLHSKYGSVVRVSPDEVSFNSTSALRVIYGAGSGFERTDFYRMFDVAGRPNLFSFTSGKAHGDRKRILAHAYAKSGMLKGDTAALIEKKVRMYLELIEREGPTSNTFNSLHYFSLDAITEFIYGRFGKTACLQGVKADRALIRAMANPDRRKLTWFSVHFLRFTEWLYTRDGALGCLARQFHPMQAPTTYMGIRRHALKACQSFSAATNDKKNTEGSSTLIARLWQHHRSRKEGGMDDLDIASECADHLMAGIETTSDTLMFVIWSLSRPEHRHFQMKVIEEVCAISEDGTNADGIPRVEASDKLPYVNAVIKETLRLFAPLPGSEPRSLSISTIIDGYTIPPRTVVSMSPYILHRNPEIFPEPSRFNPDRWLDESLDQAGMKNLFWAFSSGGRMCVGIQ